MPKVFLRFLPLFLLYLVAVPAADFVGIEAAHYYEGVGELRGLAVHQALGHCPVVGLALHADRLELVDIVGHCHEIPHGAEGQAAKISVEARHYDALALCHPLLDSLEKAGIVEIALVKSNNFGLVFIDKPFHFFYCPSIESRDHRLELALVVRDHVRRVVPVVY